MEFRVLKREDDRTRFQCGQQDLDTFFRRYAGQNQFRHQIGVTYILVEGQDIAGYVTVSAHSVRLPPEVRRKLPYDQLPVLLIARLAVSEEHQNRGLGKRLLRECAYLAMEQAEKFGCYGLATHAKPEAVDFYRKYGFTSLSDPDEGGTQLHFLSLRHIRSSLDKWETG
jgi:predicted N-acetyltransferase YhbS